MQNGLRYIARQCLLGVLALQILNMSFCSMPQLSQLSNPRCYILEDPTETVIEWLVESSFGQMAMFTYKKPLGEPGKSLMKAVVQFEALEAPHYALLPVVVRPDGKPRWILQDHRVRAMPRNIHIPPPNFFA